MRFFRRSAVLVALALAPSIASAAVQPGTVLIGTLDQTISSQTAQVGQRFTISHVHTQNNNIHDAVIYGHVEAVTKQAQGRAAKLLLTYDKLRTLSRSSYALDAQTASSTVTTKSNALKEAGGAVGGMIVGNILGKALGTNAGGAVGAAGGYLYAKNNRAPVLIQQGSQIDVTVNRAEYLGKNAP